VLRAIFGLDPRAAGQVLIDGRAARIRAPSDAIGAGIGLVPEDRKTQGLVLGMTAAANATLASIGGWGWRWRQREAAVTRTLFEGLHVRGPLGRAPVAALSGGNQQKVVLARWLAMQARVLLLDEPTRGVDVGGKAELHALIRHLLGEGVAVVLVSSELPELLTLADRILVMRAGRLIGELARGDRDASADGVLALMLGTEASADRADSMSLG
jgi:ribose transport system ATP-binding protein